MEGRSEKVIMLGQSNFYTWQYQITDPPLNLERLGSICWNVHKKCVKQSDIILLNSWVWDSTLKPIFHGDAKTFALGPCVVLDPQRENLRYPQCQTQTQVSGI